MYIPKHFEETRVEVMHALVEAHPLCTLATMGAATRLYVSGLQPSGSYSRTNPGLRPGL